MINGFEYTKIKTKDLPEKWRNDEAVDQLEKFLQDNWDQRSIFYSDGRLSSKQQFIDLSARNGIRLQNYIGTVVFKGEQLNIFPKVFQKDDDDAEVENLTLDDLVNNLVFWLGYCEKLNFPFVSMKGEISSSENLLELLITLYVHYVKSAIDKKRYFQYEELNEQGSFVKGKIDFVDYSTKKFPSGNGHIVKYRYSSFEHDNLLNRIIKCTCIFLINTTKQPSNKEILKDIMIKLADITKVNCLPYDCDRIHLSKLDRNYEIILNMSKMFLLNKVNTFEVGISESFCFLFPAEVLFEGFVGGYIKEILGNEASVFTQRSDQYLAELVVDGELIGDAFRLREDIVIETKDTIVVLDTKYKIIDKFERTKENIKLGISDSDIKQMAIYAIKRGAKKIFLIYPLLNQEPIETSTVTYNIKLEDNGNVSKIPLGILKVPFVFGDSITETKDKLNKILKSILD